MHKNFNTVAGMPTRFRFSLTADEGVDTTLIGYIDRHGEKTPMANAGESELIAPALPYDTCLYEIRAGGIVLLWGHLIARPSAFPFPSGENVSYSVEAAVGDGLVADVSVALTQGPRGPQGQKGEQGEKGDKGDPGEKGEKGDLGDPAAFGVLPVINALPADLALLPGHVYNLGLLAESTYDWSALTIAREGEAVPFGSDFLTAELCLLADLLPEITWPADMVWLEGAAPTLQSGMVYQIVLRHDGFKLIGNVAYVYSFQ